MGSRNLFLFLAFALAWVEISGHGFMFIPSGWNQATKCEKGKGAFFCKYNNELKNLPEYTCKDTENGWCAPRATNDKRSAPYDWFTNWTFVESPALIGEDMVDEDSRGFLKRGTPWTRPGQAKVFGEGCGLNGGNPTSCWEGLDVPYGTCCGTYGKGCSGYVGGRSAIEQAGEGIFDDAFVTTWKRGKWQTVMWHSSMQHMGGYAYRLCKIPPGGITKVTEECFQNGHLEFAGDYSWTYNDTTKTKGTLDPKKWNKFKAVRTTQGTFPPGSMWAKVTLPKGETGPWIAKDFVKVPNNLEVGSYILSFRWDSIKTPQVWSNCALIDIVA